MLVLCAIGLICVLKVILFLRGDADADVTRHPTHLVPQVRSSDDPLLQAGDPSIFDSRSIKQRRRSGDSKLLLGKLQEAHASMKLAVESNSTTGDGGG